MIVILDQAGSFGGELVLKEHLRNPEVSASLCQMAMVSLKCGFESGFKGLKYGVGPETGLQNIDVSFL
jgi:hypothetical protein